MSKYSYQNGGCFTIFSILGIILVSIVTAFEGQYIPLVIIICLSFIVWIYISYNKYRQNKIKQDNNIKKESNQNTSTIFISLIFIALAVTVVLIIMNINNNQNYNYIERNINTNSKSIEAPAINYEELPNHEKEIANDLNQIKADSINESITNWTTHYTPALGFLYQLHVNFEYKQNLSNENKRVYMSDIDKVAFSIDFADLNENHTDILKVISNISDFGKEVNLENREIFDDFKLIETQSHLLGNKNAIRVLQISKEITGNEFLAYVETFFFIHNMKYFTITISYPINYPLNNIDRIKNSFLFSE